jgi:hypothetical protein
MRDPNLRIADTCMQLPSKVLRIGLVATSLILTLPVAATTFEVEVGRSYSDSHGANTAFFETVFEPSAIASSNFSWEPDLSVGWIDGRNVPNRRHDNYDIRSHTFVAAAGARFQYGQHGDWYRHLFFSFQPTYNTGRTPGLSSAYEFASTLGWQGQRFSFQIRHISNAGIHDPNRGETMALVGVGF